VTQRHLASLAVAVIAILSPGAIAAPHFSGERAMQHLEDLCALGPRVPGTPAHARAHAFLVERLEAAGARVRSQPFVDSIPGIAEPVTMRNIIAEFAPERTDRVILSAHWDSRPWADADLDSTAHSKPVLGANDSASGCAVLLTIGELLGVEACAYGVDLVFFDGEDYGQPGLDTSYARGAQAFARELSRLPLYAINLDMIGDADLRVYPDRYGVERAPQLVRYVWGRAQRLGLEAFDDSRTVGVYDDHVPLLEAGVPAIDLIDFDYPQWHTLQDTPDRCSPRSLAAIGELLVSLLYDP